MLCVVVARQEGGWCERKRYGRRIRDERKKNEWPWMQDFFFFFSCRRIIGHIWEDWEKCMHTHAFFFLSFFVAKGVEAKHVGIREREKKDRGCKQTPGWKRKRRREKKTHKILTEVAGGCTRVQPQVEGLLFGRVGRG